MKKLRLILSTIRMVLNNNGMKHTFLEAKLWSWCSRYWESQWTLWLSRSIEKIATCPRHRSICNPTEATTAAATTATAHAHFTVAWAEFAQWESPIMEWWSMAVIVKLSFEEHEFEWVTIFQEAPEPRHQKTNDPILLENEETTCCVFSLCHGSQREVNTERIPRPRLHTPHACMHSRTLRGMFSDTQPL